MKSQVWCNFILAGMSITEYGLKIPSPFVSLELSNSEISSMTSWNLKCTVVGDDSNKMNVAAFEALLYSAAQANSTYENSSGIPVSFAFGWIGKDGNIEDYLSYEGFTLTFKVSTTGMYMNYELTGYAQMAIQSSMPVINIPAVRGFVQPSALVEALAHAVHADYYYHLDIDHNDSPTYIEHGPMQTSFNNYIRGNYSNQDDYDQWHGLLAYAKTYSGSSGKVTRLVRGIKSPSQVINNVPPTSLSNYIITDSRNNNPTCASFSYYVVEPTMTKQGTIAFKSDANLSTSHVSETLQYGTTDTNILSISGNYDGVAYNMTDMQFSTIGFSLDVSGSTIANDAQVVNSWSSSLADVFQTANIINDINALASQFSGEFVVQIKGSTKQYTLAQPVSLVVMSGNTLSPVSGIYNITAVSHSISNTFITTLKLQRLMISRANELAVSQGIKVRGKSAMPDSSTTKNIVSPYKADFGNIYPTFDYMPII